MTYGSGNSYSATVERDTVRHYGTRGFLNPAHQDTDKNIVRVTDVDYHIPANTKSHNTDEYSITEPQDFGNSSLVVRRGQPFDVELTLTRSFDAKKDDLKLLFEIGNNPLPSKGTRVEVALVGNNKPKEWSARVKSSRGTKLVLTVRTPANCFVGVWALSIDTKLQSQSLITRFSQADDIYVLFNPWCKDDGVYMPAEDDREEYVMNDTGKIFIGTKKKIFGRPWNFGQFEPFVLECAMMLLDKSGLGWSARGDPIKMIRRLTSLCNSADNMGVLHGNWSGDYAGGVSPLKWTGSSNILQKYYTTQTPVKYGQCWVFSGVLTAVCRALGIPARSVTNFASAHDADSSITIDTYYHQDGLPYEELNVDSVWNFHVWNEVWMARPDLPLGYGGWQAVDATPQETSEGVYCCGPASLVAIKRGEVNLNYDGPFVFAEVNADKVYWFQQRDGSWSTKLIQNSVGKFLSTKKKGNTLTAPSMTALDDPDREDVTVLYKANEGTEAERAAVLNAQKYNTSSVTLGARQAYDTGPEDVEFLLMELEVIEYGKPFRVHVKFHNKAKEKRSVTVSLSAWSMSYRGIEVALIKQERYEITVMPNTRGEKLMNVTWDDYSDECVDHAMINMKCTCVVEETNQVYIEDDDFILRKPVLQIQCADKTAVGKDMQVTFQFTNPLNQPLTKCSLEVSGPGLQDTLTVTPGNVPALKNFTYKMTVTPKKVGRGGRPRELIAKFSCKQMDDVDGHKSILITGR